MAAVLTGVRELEDIGVACIPFAAVLPLLEKEQEYAQPALHVLSRVAVIGRPLPAEVIARAPQLLMHDNPTTRYSALRILAHSGAARDSTFFVERILPGIHDFILDAEPAPLEADILPRETGCPAVLARAMHPFDRRCFSLQASTCVVEAFAAPPEQAAVSVPALLKSPTFSALLAVACPTTYESYSPASSLAARIIAQAVRSEHAGYDAVSRAAGPDKWQQLIDHVSRVEDGVHVENILLTSIMAKESVEVALQVLPAAATSLRNHGLRPSDASPELVTKILSCCAVADADETYLAAGWESLEVILETKLPDDHMAAMVDDHLPLLLSALRHETPAVRRAAVRFAGSLGKRATFPSPARAVMGDAMTETLKAIRAQDGAVANLRAAEAERHETPQCDTTYSAAVPRAIVHNGFGAAPQNSLPNNGGFGTATQFPFPTEASNADPFITAARTRLGDYSPEQRSAHIATIDEAARKYSIGSTTLRPSFNTPTDEVSDILVVLRDWSMLYPILERVGANDPAYEIAHIAIAYMKSPSDHTALALDILTCMHEQDGAAFVSSLEDDVYLAVAALAALRGHKDPAIKQPVVTAGTGRRRGFRVPHKTDPL
jgi:hypothetical protein